MNKLCQFMSSSSLKYKIALKTCPLFTYKVIIKYYLIYKTCCFSYFHFCRKFQQ